MRRIAVFALGALWAMASLCRAQDGRVGVLLELFTSEGCSSCPPADELLAKLDRFQPVKGVELIVLSEHVDYWNRGGWVDPYSSPASTERQQRYAAQLHHEEIYTPQLVIDGRSQLVGSDWVKARAAIGFASRAHKLNVQLEPSTVVDSKTVLLTVKPDASMPPGDIYLAFAADTPDAQIKAGENHGRHFGHTAAVFALQKVGNVSSTSGFTKTVALPDRPRWGGITRTVVFVQDPETGKILGVSQLPILTSFAHE